MGSGVRLPGVPRPRCASTDRRVHVRARAARASRARDGVFGVRHLRGCPRRCRSCDRIARSTRRSGRARTADGYRALPAARAAILRRMLPVRAAPSDPQRARVAHAVRAELSRRLSAAAGCRRRCARATRVLDVGAGNGWLSHRLSRLGHETVAVDLNDDDARRSSALPALRDSRSRWCRPTSTRLPFAPGQFDLVVMNASLHYAPRARAHRSRHEPHGADPAAPWS